MIIKTSVFLLLLYSVARIDADENLIVGQNAVQQSCTKEDHLDARGKLPCLLELKSSQALVEEMAKQFAAYINQFLLYRNITKDLWTTLQQNHTEYNNLMLELLKEYREDIARLQDIDSVERKQLCKTFLPRIEEKHRALESLGESIKKAVATARHECFQDHIVEVTTTWFGKIWYRLESAWASIERPLFVSIGIGLFCQFVYKVGKGIHSFGRQALLLGRDLSSLSTERAHIAGLARTTEELIGDAKMGADAQRLLRNLVEIVEPNAELAAAAEEAVRLEGERMVDAFEAYEKAHTAMGTPDFPDRLSRSRAAEVARVLSTGLAMKASQAFEIAEALQIARIAEMAAGTDVATVESAVERAVDCPAEDAAGGAVEATTEVATKDAAGATKIRRTAAAVSAEEVLAGVGTMIAAEAVGVSAVEAAPALETVAVAAAGAVAVGAVASGVAYVVDPDSTKQFYRNMWTSIKNMFGHY